jgi:hypothetical protein
MAVAGAGIGGTGNTIGDGSESGAIPKPRTSTRDVAFGVLAL